MNSSENEYLDDKKKRLEVEKLEFDVRNKQYFPPRLLIYLQPLLPSVFTLASIVGTLIILSKTKFFENANTLYEIKNQNLKAEGEKLEKLKLGLDSNIFILRDSISKLSSSINVYKSVLGKTKNSMTTCQQEIAKLTIDLNRANETNKANESNITRLNTELNMARITKIDPSLAGGPMDPLIFYKSWVESLTGGVYTLKQSIQSLNSSWRKFENEMRNEAPAPLYKKIEAMGYEVHNLELTATAVHLH